MFYYDKIVNKILGKIANSFVIKKKNSIYAEPHINCKTDQYDLINCNADNTLKVLNYFVKNYHGDMVKLYIEIYDESRLELLNEYVRKIGNPDVSVRFLMSCWGSKKKLSLKGISRYLKNTFIRYTCKIWVCDTGWAHFFDKTHFQTLICFAYCTPFKKSGVYSKFLTQKHFDHYVQTSMDTSKILASEYRCPFENFESIGFARNDTVANSDKKEQLERWLEANNISGKKIIIYVPTYRPRDVDYSNTDIFGFENDGELDRILKENNAALIVKLHPIQMQYHVNLPENIIPFQTNYDFTIYDLFSACDVLISDYSSIANDFLVAHKPVIYNFSDFDEYEDERGFSFEPIQDICCGDVIYNKEELTDALTRCLNQPDYKVENYDIKFRRLHKYDDHNATKRNYQLLKSQLK